MANAEESAKVCEGLGILHPTQVFRMGLANAEPIRRDFTAQVLDCAGEQFAFFQPERHTCI